MLILIIVFVCIFSIFGVGLLHSCRVKTVSLSMVVPVIFVVTVVVPAVFLGFGVIAEGALTQYNVGPKVELLVIALSSMLLLFTSVFLGNHLAKNTTIYCQPRWFLRTSGRIFWLLIGVIVFFLIIYSEWASGTSPLINYLSGDLDLYGALVSRSGLRDGSLGFWGSRIDWIFAPIASILLFIGYEKFLSKKNVSTTSIFVLGFLFLALIKFYRLGRDDMLIVLMVMSVYVKLGTNELGLARLIIPLISVVMAFVYFSPFEVSGYALFATIIDRIINQTAYTYLQIDVIENGFLYLDGFRNPLSNNYISPSKVVYDQVYGRSGGSTAGYAFANMYYIFGPLGLLIAGGLCSIIFYVDKVFINTLKASGVNATQVRPLYGAFFSVVTMPVLFNLLGVFNFMLFLNLASWLFVISTLCFFKVRFRSI